MANELYKTIEITVADGAEGLTNLLESTDVEPKHVVKVTTPQTTTDVDLLIWEEREKLADIPLDCSPLSDKWLEINRDIAVGETVQAGFRNNSGASITYHITVWYRLR